VFLGSTTISWKSMKQWTVARSSNEHYQKVDKYKRKYRGNISIGKFPRDFTDGNIPSVYTKGITVEKKIKTKQKKMMTCQDLPTESPTDFVRRYFSENSTTVHFPITLLIVVLYGQNH